DYGLRLFDITLRLPFTFIANSSHTKELILGRNPSARVYVSGVGVDTNVFRPRRERVIDSGGKPIVMAIIRGARFKGDDVAIKALNIINREVPIHAVLISGGNAVERIFREVKPEFDHTVFRGVSDDLMARLYSSSDVFIFTSYKESFGLPPLEAMASGTAVITTDCGGDRDYAVNGYNSLVVPPGDPSAVANATIRVLKDGKLKERLVEGGLETAKKWTWDKVVDVFERAIKGA
ncbi:MAG: glycosyltransferase family 4 protein, partial [Vulcanisaeta sp.]